MNARLIPGPGDAPLPTISRAEVNTLFDQQDTLEEVANQLDDARLAIPILADFRLDRRAHRISRALLHLAKLAEQLAVDVRDSVED